MTDITISPTSDAPTFDTSFLNNLDGYTFGLVNTNTVKTISGFLSDLITSYQSTGITNLGDENIILRDEGTVSATDLTTLASLNKSGTIDAGTINNINGTALEIIAVYSDPTILEPQNVSLTVNSGNVSVSQARLLNSSTDGVVTGTITPGTTISEMVNEDTGLTESVNAYQITIAATDAEATATNLTALYGKTSLPVDATAVTQITGTVEEANIVYAAD